MGMKTTFICPYCFEKHKLSEVQFRCTNKRCKDFDDVEMTKYENGNLKMPKQGKKTFLFPQKTPSQFRSLPNALSVETLHISTYALHVIMNFLKAP